MGGHVRTSCDFILKASIKAHVANTLDLMYGFHLKGMGGHVRISS